VKPAFALPEIGVQWDRLADLAEELGVLTAADGPALELAARAAAEIVECERRIRKDGRFYSTKSEGGPAMVRPHPAVRVSAAAEQRLITVLAHFGLTPSSRAKVQTAPKQELDELESWEVIRGGKA
jgi:P27 family predicted phage terminase small subunit